MRKHITQAEILRIGKLYRSGITEVAEIQQQVFVHAQCIEQVLEKLENEEKPVKKKAAKKKRAVDPLS